MLDIWLSSMLDKKLEKNFFVLYNMFKMLDIILKGIRYASRKIYKKVSRYQ